MLFCCVCTLYNQFCCRMTMNCKMHFILYGFKEQPRCFCIFIIIKCGRIQIRDLLIELALRQSNLPNLLQLPIKVFICEHMSFFQAFLIHGPALDGMVFHDLPRPFAKLHRTGIIDLKSNSDDHLKRVMLQFSRWCRCADTGSHAPGRTARKMRRRRGQGPVFRPADRRPACAGP